MNIDNDSSKWKSMNIEESDNKYSSNKIPKTINLALDISLFSVNNVLFLETKKNKIIEGSFTNVIYSDCDTVFNGIYLKIKTKDSNFENKFLKLSETHNNIIKELTDIENSVINHYRFFFNCKKIVSNVVHHHFKTSNDARDIITNNMNSPIFKISGIWENKTHIGITLKIMK